MSGPPSLKSLVCEEVFDERSQPSEEEVREFAVKIGIDPDEEPHLIPLAREGLLKPLPKNWKPVYDPHTKLYYYFNFKTHQSSWEHPLDNKFRDLVKKSRSESISSAGEEDSKTSIKEDLKSFEETAASIALESDTSAYTRDSLMDFPSQKGRPLSAHSSLFINPLAPTLKSALSPVRSNFKGEQDNASFSKQRGKLSTIKSDLKPIFSPKPLFSSSLKNELKTYSGSLKEQTKSDWDNSEETKDVHGVRFTTDPKYFMSLDSSVRDESPGSPSSSVIGRFTVDRVRKIDIDFQSKRLDSDGVESTHRSSDRFPKNSSRQAELTLSGGGSVFLKSNQRKKEEKKPEELSEGRSGYGNDSENVGILEEINSSLQSLKSNSIILPHSNLKSVPSWDIDSSTSAPHRSILRTPQGERRLWDIDPQDMSVSEKTLWKQQELEEEKKSVRFNLDKELNIMFKLSDSSSSESSSEVEEVEEDEESPELSGSKAWIEEYQQIRSKRLKTTDVEESPRAEKHLSPLEEWAKKTWFSEKSSIDHKESESLGAAMKNTSDIDSVLHEVDLSEKTSDVDAEEDQIEEAGHASNNTVKDKKVPVDFKSQEKDKTDPALCADERSASQAESIQNALLEGNSKVSKLDEVLEQSNLMKQFSPASQIQTSGETDILLSSLNKKLESIVSREMHKDSVSQEERAREQAYRDWNVMFSDSEMHRPQLSRQQSQQQILHMKQKIQEPTRASDRDRALREWSVTKGLNESDIGSKAIPANSDLEALVDKNSSTSSSEGKRDFQEEYPIESQMPVGSDAQGKSWKDSNCDAAINNFQMTGEMKDFAVKQEIEYEKRIKTLEHEYKLRFDKDQGDIVMRYQEKLQERFQEESQRLESKFREMMTQLERESDTRMKQLREQLEHKQECATQKLLEQHQKALAAQEVENQAKMLRLREQHSADVKTFKEQLQKEEEQIRREHQERIASIREDRDGKRSREITDQLRVIEKLRCEKRIVEDKYRTLKEKYVKLKGERKANLEKKDHKYKDVRRSDEKGKQGPVITEQEISASHSQHQSDRSSETESRPKTVSSGSSATPGASGFQQAQQLQREQLHPPVDPPSPAPNSGPSETQKNNNNDTNGSTMSFLGISFCNPALQRHTPSSNNNGHVSFQASRQNPTHKAAENNGNVPCAGQEDLIGHKRPSEKIRDISPLEALRRQLQTLDELEEQFPASSVTDAYLRYPFSDTGSKELGSAELEFFRHRIHLERDMIRQAKNSLQAQQSEYRSRLRNFQQHQSSSSATLPSTTLYQMAKEEQELSEMEDKLQLTRRVLSEKIIHLRQLENSLYRLTAPTTQSALQTSNEVHARRENKFSERFLADKVRSKTQCRWDWKIGTGLWGRDDVSDDMSSDSGESSGFSSTEYTSDGTLASLLSQSGSGRRIKKIPENSSDVNLSLHNLNAEISEIWNVLCKQRAAAGLGPPPLLTTNTQTPAWVDTSSNSNAPCVTSIRTSSTVLSSSGSMVIPDRGTSLIERTNNLRLWLQKAKMTATVPDTAAKKDRNELPF